MTDTAPRFGQPHATTPRRWGKAGVRLTADEIDAADRRRRTEANKARLRGETEHRRAHRDWRSGLVQPWRITRVLDARGLYGPEVDQACGVQEPTVDLWEAGLVYPTFEQLCALAALVEITPGMLMYRGFEPLRARETTLRFHMDVEHLEEPVMRFTVEAVALTLAGEGACPTCGHRGAPR